MAWLRDNWLDALIFVLFALVVGGIVLFLTGVNPFRGSDSSPPAVSPSRPPVEVQVPSASTPTPVTPQPSPSTPAPVTPQPSTPPVTVVPLPSAPIETTPAPATPSTPRPTPNTAAPSTPRTTPPSSSSGTWRVVAGAFSNPQNADRLAQTLRQQGYSVRLESAANLTRVVVGPYATEASARQVAQALSEYGAQASRVPNTTTPATPPTAAPTNPAPPAATAPTNPAPTQPAANTPNPPSNPSPAANVNVYLQVGAFRSVAGAEGVIGQLQGLGYGAVLVQDGELYKVRVVTSPASKESVAAGLRAVGFQPLEVK